MRRRAPVNRKRRRACAVCLATCPAAWYIRSTLCLAELPLMSLVVKLEDDLGERSEWVIMHGVIPDHEIAEFPLLSCIDPFGKTVFNHLQAEIFLVEWE